MFHPDLLLDTLRLEQARRLRDAERLWAVRRRRRDAAAAQVTSLPVRPSLHGDGAGDSRADRDSRAA